MANGKRGAGRPATNTVSYYRRVKPEWVPKLTQIVDALKENAAKQAARQKEVLKRGYVTHALTNENDEIYGIIENHYVNWETQAHRYYWSEVYHEGNMTMIIRKGMLLVDPTPEELKNYFEQSKVNLN